MMFNLFGPSILVKVISNAATDTPSAKRFVLVISAIFMCVALLMLSIAYVVGASVAAEAFWAITVPLSLMAGASYSSVEIAKVKALGVPPVAPAADNDNTLNEGK